MQTKKNLWLLGASVMALILLGAFYFLRSPKASAPTSTATSTDQSATTTYDLGNGITATGPSGAKITVVPVSSSVQQPNLDAQVQFSSNLSPDVVAALKTQIAQHVAVLKKNPKSGEDWLGLAMDYKIAGDYHLAENVWVFMTEVSPSDPVAFTDLGDLYQNFLKNYLKAETNYLAALKLDPHDIDLYRNLYTLYKYQLKEPAKATAIVQQGLQANPNNSDLELLQKQG